MAALLLVVDDDPVSQMAARRLLEGLGHQVETASLGTEALRLLEDRRFDLVFMDRRMPGMDGLETARRIRTAEASGSRMPIIALTGMDDPEEREICQGVGMDDFLTKPLRADAVARILDRWLSPGNAPRVLNPDRLAKLQALGRGQRDVVKELAALFLTHLPVKRDALKAALGSGDLRTLREEAHALKGSSANLGADRLARCSVRLEAAAEDGDLDACRSLFPSFEEAVDEVEAALSEM